MHVSKFAAGAIARKSVFVALCLGAMVLTASCRNKTVAPPKPAISVTGLRAEHRNNPLGIDVRAPRLSWQIQSDSRNAAQSAYQIRVARTADEVRAGKELLSDSGKVASAQSVLLPYHGAAIESGQRYYWQVRVWDVQDRASDWSEPAFWEMGLLSPQDWTAQWITTGVKEAAQRNPAPLLRRTFTVGEGAIRRARVYVTSRGLYELRLNGQAVGDELFTPGWTDYNKRLQYQTYDVTEQIKPGANAVGAMLGDGWYRGEIGFSGQRNQYGNQAALLLQLEIVFADGRRETVVSDTQWKSSTGPIVSSEIYDGEIYDARLEKSAWDTVDYADTGWSPVKSIEASKDVLVAPAGPPVKRIEEVQVVKVLTTPKGKRVLDFGQNLVGRVRFKVQGAAGTGVTLRHAEVLDAAGELYTENLRNADQTVRYVLKGQGEETYEPHFSFQGFRYVEVEGYPGELAPAAFTAVVIHSDMPRSGEFETSKELVNRLQHNIQWGQKGNFLDVPTDCPQRDERLGWTGDAQVFAPTAAFNMDVAAFFTKWLKDVAAEQLEDGAVPFVVPNVLKSLKSGPRAAGASGWGDAATVIPWEMYLAYGDIGVLESQYDSMSKWVGYQQSRAGEDLIWDGDFGFGDWLDFFGASKGTNFGLTSTDLISTAYFARSTNILRQTAEVLGKPEDAARYAELFKNISAAFTKKFVNADGTVGEGTQTAYVLALHFDLLPEELRAKAAEKLVADVRRRGHLTTGFLGTPHLLAVLTRFGYLQESYQLLNREEYPSWLYPVKRGATTIWERWDGLKPDGSFQNKKMNSFNHYAYGAVGDWMYRIMAGINIDPAAPGYKHTLIQPMPGGGFTKVRGHLQTPYGLLSSAWEVNGGTFTLQVKVPANTRATLRLPRAAGRTVLESGRALQDGGGVASHSEQGADTMVEVGSGDYRFSYPWQPDGAPVTSTDHFN